MRSFIITIILFLGIGVFPLIGQGEIPNKPNVERLVVDFAHVLSTTEKQRLEEKLEQYSRETSTQIAVVTVKSLNGYERAEFTTRLAQKWGIGSAKYDNGILLLVKPRYNDSKGQVQIATGYGLEGAATDLACGQIRNNILIPHFKRNDYFGGIDKATDALIALTRGEYNDEYAQEEPVSIPFSVIITIILVVFILFSSLKRKAKGQYQMSKNGGSVPMWLLLELLTRNTGSSSFDDFNSGSGGFGGFGGGSFGGGGAGGSW